MNQIELGIVKCESAEDTGASVTFGLLPLIVGTRYRITATPCDATLPIVPRCSSCNLFIARHEVLPNTGTCLWFREQLGIVVPVPVDGSGYCHRHDPRPT